MKKFSRSVTDVTPSFTCDADAMRVYVLPSLYAQPVTG